MTTLVKPSWNKALIYTQYASKYISKQNYLPNKHPIGLSGGQNACNIPPLRRAECLSSDFIEKN